MLVRPGLRAVVLPPKTYWKKILERIGMSSLMLLHQIKTNLHGDPLGGYLPFSLRYLDIDFWWPLVGPGPGSGLHVF